MSGDGRSLDEIRRVARDLVPELARRLRDHGLGEIEVRRGDLRLRVQSGSQSRGHGGEPAAGVTAETSPSRHGAPGESDPGRGPSAAAVSPAVGVFVYAEGLGPGLSVSAGDSLGHVDMLGVHHEVSAPQDGRVTHLVAETGEAVEYGQVLIELEPEPVR